jgi:hypothetical protein
MCGSPAEVEHAGYTLAVSTAGAKLQRKGADVQQVRTARIQAGKDHVITFERSGATLRGFLDGATAPFIEWTDPQPLRGAGHGTMGFYVYGGAISIGDVKVEALPPQAVAAAAEPEPQTKGPQVTLRGNPCTEDSFAKAIHAAAQLLGRNDVPLDTIRALSTNGFAPCIRPDEPCRSWWDVQAQDRGIDLVAARVGLRYERLPIWDHASDPPQPKEPEAFHEWLRTCFRKPMVPAIRKAFDEGKVVITPNEWDFRFHSNAWYGWGVIVDATEDGTILGACLNGRRDNPMNYVGASACAIAPAAPTLDAHQADVAMLRRAVERIRGQVEPIRADESGEKIRYVFGLAAMDLWIETMRTVPGYCAECQERGGGGWSDALDNGKLMHDGAVLVASYLRSRLETFPEASRAHLESAARHYDRIAQLLRPSITANDPAHYKTFIGDLAKQTDHAEKVLKPVKAELAAAADEMAKALAADGVTVRPTIVQADKGSQ